MPGTSDRSLDSLIKGSEELIRDLETAGSPSNVLPEPIAQAIERQVAVPLESFAQPSSNGRVEISVPRDEMLAHANFYPPTGNGTPLTLEMVREAINAKGITAGVDWEAVKGCLLTCNEERLNVLDVVIARGKKPIDEVPPYLVLSDKLV